MTSDLAAAGPLPPGPVARLDGAYRPDIDGLRAIAVLSVVAFHAFPGHLPGGFVGVDIFFVISGFLISGIIFKGLDAGRFGFGHFYARRIKRIFPALGIVLGAFILFGWFSFLPDEYTQLGKHTMAGGAFVSNLVLWRESNYFDAAPETKPLLHLWSLGVEEQFYLIWPALLVLGHKARVNRLLLIGVIGTSSLVVNLAMTGANPTMAFYSPATRFWELLIGAGLAHLSSARPLAARPVRSSFTRASGIIAGVRASPWMKNLQTAVGMCLLATALLLISGDRPFPGWRALLPAAGAVLVLSGGSGSWINRRLLSGRALVTIGLISYPLYLWHWPLLVVAAMTTDAATAKGRLARLVAIALAFVLSYLTYRFCERPIRAVGHLRLKLALPIVVVTLVTATGGVIYAKAGFRSRFPADILLMSDALDLRSAWRYGRCFLYAQTQNGDAFAPECLQTTPATAPLVFLWGDSHVADLYPGLKSLQERGSFRLAQFTATSCPPLFDSKPSKYPSCSSIQAYVERKIAEVRPMTVVLGAWWSNDRDNLDRKVENTVSFLRANGVQNIVLVGPQPSWQPTLRQTLFRYYRISGVVPYRIRPEEEIIQPVRDLDSQLRNISARYRIHYISALGLLCDAGGCLTRVTDALPDGLVSADSDHFSVLGSEYFVRRAFSVDELVRPEPTVPQSNLEIKR